MNDEVTRQQVNARSAGKRVSYSRYWQMRKDVELSPAQVRVLRLTGDLIVTCERCSHIVFAEGVGDEMKGPHPLLDVVLRLTREIRTNLDRVFPEGSGGEEKADEWLARLREGKDPR